MNELLNCGPGIGIFIGMAITGIILMTISFLTGKKSISKR